MNQRVLLFIHMLMAAGEAGIPPQQAVDILIDWFHREARNPDVTDEKRARMMLTSRKRFMRRLQRMSGREVIA